MGGNFPNSVSAQDVCQHYEGGAFSACQLGVSMKNLGNVCNEYYASSYQLLIACQYGYNS